MTKQKNPMIIHKETSPYMYLNDFSGIYLNNYNPETINRGISIKVNDSVQDNFYLVSFQIWARFPKKIFSQTQTVFKILNGATEIEFLITPMAGGTKAKLSTLEPCKLYKNGNLCSSFIIRSEEWFSLYAVFDSPIDFGGVSGSITLYPDFVFNNISQYIYENQIDQITVAIPLIWKEVLYPDPSNLSIVNTWQEIEQEGTWNDAKYDSISKNDYILTGDYIYGNQVGTSVVVNDDTSTTSVFSNGADLFTNVEWQKIEKSLI